MVRTVAAGLAGTLVLGVGALHEAERGVPPFSVTAPRVMVRGPVFVTAQAADESVTAVRWTVGDWSRLTPRPFELTFDAGPVPYERRLIAVALDRDRRPLYRKEVILNPGGRALDLEFRRPVDGQRAAGSLPVELRVQTPANDEPAVLDVDVDGQSTSLAPAGPGLFTGVVTVPAAETALVARLRTLSGLEAERTVLLNTRGVIAESDAHVVEQLVGVTRHGAPLEDLRREEFTVRDERGSCEVRDARLVREAPLALGFAVDVSVSLNHTEELKRVAALQFIEECLKPKDVAFLLEFGPAVVKVQDWTRSKEALQKAVLELSGNVVPGTALYEGIVKSLYGFQGQQGARALVLVTDGHDFEGEVTEETALAYARQSGVKIYALGLTSSYDDVSVVTRRDTNGKLEVVERRHRTVVQPTNVEVLSRFAEATGGQVHLVKKEKDLPTAFRAIEHDIRTQYLVSYVSSVKRRNTFHPVEVKTRRGKVQTAAGFFY